jgi:hypothetical protein
VDESTGTAMRERSPVASVRILGGRFAIPASIGLFDPSKPSPRPRREARQSTTCREYPQRSLKNPYSISKDASNLPPMWYTSRSEPARKGQGMLCGQEATPVDSCSLMESLEDCLQELGCSVAVGFSHSQLLSGSRDKYGTSPDSPRGFSQVLF